MQEEAKSSGAQTNVPWAVQISPIEEAEKPAENGPAAPASAPQKSKPDTRSDVEVHCDEAVVRALMDVLIMPDGKIQPQERAFASDLLQLVIEHANTKSKSLLCERLANMTDAPAALISRFLNDAELEIAKPLLLRASCVSESELISIVESGDHERSRLIARREHLTPVVTTALAKSANEDIELDLVNNRFAQLSEEAVQLLTCSAEKHSKLIKPLVHRPEMTAACALRLIWVMSPKLRSYAFSRFLVDVQVLRQILVMSQPGVDLIKNALNGSGGHSQGGDTADLVSAMAEVEVDELARLLGLHADIAPAAALRIVEDHGAEPLTIACKALGVARVSFAEAIEKWKAGRKLDADTEQLKILFDTFSFRQARMALTYWDWQTRGAGPYTDFQCDTDDVSIAYLPWVDHRSCPR